MKLGGDPEVFLVDSKGQLVSSIGRIGGQKGKGVQVHQNVKAFTWLEDNVAVEFNFPACDHPENFCETVKYLMSYGKDTLRKQGLNIKVLPWAKFPHAQLGDDKAHVFGCEPDFEAYEYAPNGDPPPERQVDVGEMGDVRFGGGHLHLGFENKHKIPHHAVAILCDMFIGLPSVCLDHQGIRRAFYGKAGLYRPKPYGIEYRTMSNWWLAYENRQHVMNMAYEAFELMRAMENRPDELARVFDKTPIQDVRQVINQGNVKEAYNIWYGIYARCRGLPNLGELSRNFMAQIKPVVNTSVEKESS